MLNCSVHSITIMANLICFSWHLFPVLDTDFVNLFQ